jgi:hypothetical protein
MADETREPLVCPRCATTHGLDERFCPACGMPLVYAGHMGVDQPVTEAHERARKIKPQYSEGELVRVARAAHQAEAEFIQGLLLEEGVPSTVRRSAGFDVPDMLAAGPRDVLVPASGAEPARDVLLEARIVTPVDPDAAPITAPGRLLAGLLIGLAVVALLVWIGTEIAG